MPQYIAFLRGLNVGGHRVKMDRLRKLFEELGLTDVSTFIASGNVVFTVDSADVEAVSDEIEQHLATELGYEVATFLRSPAQLDEIVAQSERPDAERGLSTTPDYVIFLRGPAPKQLRSTFESLGSEIDQFHFAGAEIYWRTRGKLSESPLFAKEMGAALRGTPSTTRNTNTLRRLSEKIRKPGT